MPLQNEVQKNMTVENISQITNERNEAVEHIHQEYCQWIYATIEKLVRHGDDVDDIFQDFFVLLLTKPQLANSIRHKGFLYRTLSRDVIDFMRRKKAYQNRLTKFADKKPPPTQCESTLDSILSQQECQLIYQLIDQKLPASLGKVLKLHLNCNCNHAEIARRLNIGPSSARRYLYLSRKRMKVLLAENGYHFKFTD